MVDIISSLPLTMGGIISLFINAIIAFVAILVVDKFVGHELKIKHALIMAIVALFITPVLSAFLLTTAVPGFVSVFLLPLLVWILLGELLLGEDMKKKLEIATIAYVVYIVLTIVLLPFVIPALPV